MVYHLRTVSVDNGSDAVIVTPVPNKKTKHKS